MFIRFKSAEQQDRFLEQLDASRPELRKRAFARNATTPVVVFHGLEESNVREIRALAGPDAEIFENRRFEPFERE